MSSIPNIEAAALQILLEPINAALTSIQENPTALNAAAQFTALQASFITNLPAFEALGIKDSASLIQQKLNAYVIGLSNPISSVPAEDPSPVIPAINPSAN